MAAKFHIGQCNGEKWQLAWSDKIIRNLLKSAEVGTCSRSTSEVWEPSSHRLPKSGFPWDTEIRLWVDFSRSLEQVNFRQSVQAPSTLLSSIIKRESQNLWAKSNYGFNSQTCIFSFCLFHYNITFPPWYIMIGLKGKKEEIFQIVVFYPKKSFDSSSPCSEFHSISNGTNAKLQNNIKEGC